LSQLSDGRVVGPDRLLSTLEQLLAIDATSLDPALQQAAQVVSEVLGADKVDVFVYESGTESLVARGTSNTPLGRRQHAIGMDRLPLAGLGRCVEVFHSGRSYQDGAVDEDRQELIGIREGLGVRSQVVVPLVVNGRRRGVVCAVSTQRDYFSAQDMAFLEAVSHWTSLVMHRTELAQVVVERAEERGRRKALADMLQQLTPRQLEVAVLIANGYSNHQIAERLVLTEGTVANHVAQLLDRLGMDSRTQVAALVAEVGLHRDGVASDVSGLLPPRNPDG
jgi:DNA-binding CsgD family transcriptional regulator